MPATTRSKKKQVRLEDLPTTGTPQSRKRPAAKEEASNSARSKKPRTAPSDDAPRKQPAENNSNNNAEPAASPSNTIAINRSPVLQLWAACVAQFLYPNLSSSTDISIGGAVATICAVAKGRSIGKIDQSNEKDKPDRSKDKASHSELEIMQFKIQIKDGVALVGEKPKPGNESPLRSKFGNRYEEIKKLMLHCLESWKEDKDGLNKLAFGFYEQFRPSVSPGQSGWGKKGELNLDKISKVVQKT